MEIERRLKICLECIENGIESLDGIAGIVVKKKLFEVPRATNKILNCCEYWIKEQGNSERN